MDLSNDTQAPAGFGGQGVVNAPEAIPTGPPPGFGGQGAVTLPSQQENRALPSPPPGYMPGYTAPVRQTYEDSTFFKIGSVLASYGEKVPVNLQLRLAQQAADLQQSHVKLGWDNYYKSNQAAQDTIKDHNREAMKSGLEMLPHFKGVLNSIEDPEKRTAMATHFGQLLDNFAPGLGEVMRTFDKNPSHVLGYDMLMKHPVYGPRYQNIAATMSYEQQMKDPGVQQVVESLGRDTIPKIISRFNKKEHATLVSGTMTEPEFTEAYDRAMNDQSLGPIDGLDTAFAKSVLHTQYGEEIMKGFKVQTNKSLVKLEGKAVGSSNPLNAIKAKEFDQNQFKIDHAADLGLSTDEVSKLQAHNDRLLTYTGAESKPGESKTSLHSSALFDLSGGLYQTKQDILDKTPEGSPARKQGLAWSEQATQVQKTASSQAQLGARMQEPAKPEDLSNMFSAKALLSGHVLEPVAPQSTLELRTNPNNVKISPDEQVKYSNLTTALASGKELFALADKAFKETTHLGMLNQAAKYAMLDSKLTAGAVAMADPDMAVYHDLAEAWGGKNAKALGSESGVLTDRDINRWVSTFPTSADTADTRKAKQKIFNKMIQIVRDTQEQVMAGRLTVTRDDNGRIANKDFRQKIEGLLGSAEALTPKTGTQASTSGQLSPRQKLEQQMRAE